MDRLKVLLLSLTLLSPALTLSGGGPDRAGYRWLDSENPGGPAFDWTDISSVGTEVPMGDDDNRGPFPLGFTFTYYGAPYDSIRICSNGWLSFTSESHQFHLFPIPWPDDPNALLAPFWFDLDPSAGGRVYYHPDTTDSIFVAAWYGVPPYGGSGGYTFEVVLKPGGDILYQYKRMQSSAGAESTSVGIENRDGTIGLEYFYRGSPPPNIPHDSLAVRFYQLEHDVMPVQIHSPLARIFPDLEVVPRVTVKNYGKNPQTFEVACQISDSSTGAVAYQDTAWVSDLPYLGEAFLEFSSSWHSVPGTYQVTYATLLAGDEDPSNDTLRRYTTCSYRAELAYDDGEPDNFRYIGGSPTVHWALAVRFTPSFSPYRALGGRILVDGTSPFEEVLLCPGSAGIPDVAHPYDRQEWVSAGSPHDWASAPFDTIIDNSDDIWLVAVWPLGATDPQVGEDTDPPVDNRSYYGVPGAYWNPWAAGDWIMRIEIDGTTPVQETPEARSKSQEAKLGQSYPNPFSHSTTILFSLQGSRGAEEQGGKTSQIPNRTSHISLRIYDVAGRPVRTLALGEQAPGSHSVIWDGTDDRGAQVAGGIYFCRLSVRHPDGGESSKFSAAKKLTLLR